MAVPAESRRHAERDLLLARLAREAGTGDRTAFERLVAETAPQIYALVLRLVGNEHDARDVVQETYLRAFSSIGRFRNEAAVTTWLYRIAANCSATHCSRRRPTLPLEAASGIADERPEQDPAVASGDADAWRRLVNLLGGLPVALRAVVVLHDVYGFDHEAIATELGISRAASKVRLHRARRRLREQLFPERSLSSQRPDASARIHRLRPAEHEPHHGEPRAKGGRG